MKFHLYATAAWVAVVLTACDQGNLLTQAQEPEPERSETRQQVRNEAAMALVSRPAEKLAETVPNEDLASGPRPAPIAPLSDVAVAGHKSLASPETLMGSATSIRQAVEPLERERYARFDDNPLKRVAEHPVSTFSIDVDSGSYANVRRFLTAGQMPPQDAVRVEEMLNYFAYDYPAPANREIPFSIATELAATPWNPNTRLLQVGIKGYEIAESALPPANLVFLVDVSGSMQSPDKLELLKSGLKLLVSRLRAEDRIAIVAYAGASGVVLESTPGNETAKIHSALEGLASGGSTNGAAGIRLAYSLAKQHWIEGGINRVLLATDGDFNVGTVDFEDLKDLVERERRSGVSLTTLGFGTGNYNDHLMEQLADAGNGNYAYVDTLKEANRVLVQQMAGTLATIAKDVKIQIEFNPAVVAEYRLIGYENRALRREDFSNDKVDAGEIGAGHTVTAMYEVALVGQGGTRIEPLRYAPEAGEPETALSSELAHLRIRYKAPNGASSRLIEQPVEAAPSDGASEQFRFAAAVAGFGQILRGGNYTGRFGYADVLELARGARGDDPDGYRGEFIQIVGLASSLDRQAGTGNAPGRSG